MSLIDLIKIFPLLFLFLFLLFNNCRHVEECNITAYNGQNVFMRNCASCHFYNRPSDLKAPSIVELMTITEAQKRKYLFEQVKNPLHQKINEQLSDCEKEQVIHYLSMNKGNVCQATTK